VPAIPLTTISNGQQGRTSTSFNDDGHYSDIHLNVAGGEGAAGIPMWRRSIVNDPGHYDYPEFNRVTSNDSGVEQPQRSSGYQGLNPAELALLRQPCAPDPYTGMRSNQPGLDPQEYLAIVEESENGNHDTGSQVQPPTPDHYIGVGSNQPQSRTNAENY